MLGWFKNKVRNAGLEAAKRDLSHWNAGLRGADGHEVAEIVVAATMVRLAAQRGVAARKLAEVLHCPNLPDPIETAFACADLGATLRAARQQGKPEIATGGMVWLHSLRCVGYPELREQGRAMWSELSRGFEWVGTPECPAPQWGDEHMFIPKWLYPERS